MDSYTADRSAWRSLLEAIRAVVTRQQFETWFRNLRFVSATPGNVVVGVPNAFHREWIESYYLDLIRDTLLDVTGQTLSVEVQIAGSRPDAPARAAEDTRPARSSDDVSSSGDAAPPRDVTRASPAHAGGPTDAQPSFDHQRSMHTPGGSSNSGGSYSQGTPNSQGASTSQGSFNSQGNRGGQDTRGSRSRRRNVRSRPAARPAETELFGHPRYPHFLSDVILNEDYVFSNFVTGPSNQLASAASAAVANNPAQEYNPLFLHGDVGLGKTHLLQGICARLLSANPDMRITYLSCETFVNQFISAVEAGGLADFRYRYRHVDMLLIDDIHFLARKERTQEEFFHTFNTLYNSQKQIVLSCDSPPSEIPTLEDRLVSRFKWGLVTQILPPDHETRISIVRRKAERRGVTLAHDVSLLIADHVTSNVRELEGAVLRVIGYAALTGQELTLSLAEEALKDILEPRERNVSVEAIIRTVAEVYNVKVSELMGRRRNKSISRPRQVCMYLARQLTEYSLVEIGGQLGGRDHTTVIYATEKIARELESDARLKDDLDMVVRKLRSSS